MAAFLNYIMSSTAQANLVGLGFGQVPTAVIAYSVQRALPLLSVDTSQGAPWYFEPSAGIKFDGAVNNVFSAAKDTYVHTAAIQLILAAQTKSNSTTSSGISTGSLNVSALNLTSQLGSVSSLQGQVNQNQSQIAILTSIAIASLVFGISGLALAMFATIRLVIVGTHVVRGNHSVYPGSMSGNGSQSVKGAKGGGGGGSSGGLGRGDSSIA